MTQDKKSHGFGYQGTHPVLEWLNDHYSKEYLTDKSWSLIDENGVILWSTTLDNALALAEALPIERTRDALLLYINLTDPPSKEFDIVPKRH